MSSKPRIILDTTAINRLEDSGTDSEPLMRGLESGYLICLTAMSADEIISITKNPQRREALLNRFGWLLSDARCIWPPNEVVRLHVIAYQHDPGHYDWHRVNMRAKEYEDAIPRRAYPDDISLQQRKVQFELEEQWAKSWKSLRPKLDEIIARDPKQHLASFRDAAQASINPGGVLWGFGKGLYDHATGNKDDGITDDEVKAFIKVCPPFRAACYALVMAWYNLSLSPTHVKIPKAGRNDLMMATYLPYCDRFLTQDFAQHRDLSAIALAAGLQTEVTLFEQFSQSFNPILPAKD